LRTLLLGIEGLFAKRPTEEPNYGTLATLLLGIDID
jgi:hypothetical protein